MRIVEGERNDEGVQFVVACDCGARFLWDLEDEVVECPGCGASEALDTMEIDLPDRTHVQSYNLEPSFGNKMQTGFNMLAGFDAERFHDERHEIRAFRNGILARRRVRCLEPSI